MRLLGAATALVLVGACGGRTPLGKTVLPDGGVGDVISSTRTLHGRFIVHYFPDAGELDVPKDLSSSTIAVYAMGATLPGSGKADGTLSVDNVPPTGPYTLRVDDLIVVGVEDGVTLTSNAAGRPDADRSSWAPHGPPQLLLTLDGLAPMPPPDTPVTGRSFMFVCSTNAGCEMGDAEVQWAPVPPTGSTSVTGVYAPFTGGSGPCRMDPSRGDRSFFLQFVRPADIDPLPHVNNIAKLDLPSFSTAAGDPIAVTGTLEVAPLQTFQADFRPSSFIPALFVPGAKPPTASISIDERPPVSLYAQPWAGLGGLATYANQTDGPFTIPYPDPFPGWTKVLTVYARTDLEVPLPGSSQTYWSALTVKRILDYEPTMGPIAIALSPPRNVVVGSAAPFMPTTGAGTTPTSHRSTPDYQPVGLLRYSLDIADMSPNGGGNLPTIWTTETSVVVPSGFLQPGHVYATGVTVHWSQQQVDFATAPLDGDFTEIASAPGGTFTP